MKLEKTVQEAGVKGLIMEQGRQDAKKTGLGEQLTKIMRKRKESLCWMQQTGTPINP